MAFEPKDWHDAPDESTPISAAALEDLEIRLSDYTDSFWEDGATMAGPLVIQPPAEDQPLIIHGQNEEPAFIFHDIAGVGHPDEQAPVLIFRGTTDGDTVGEWGMGIDVAAAVRNRDFIMAFKSNYPTPGTVHDFVIAKHNGDEDPYMGIATDDADYRFSIIGANITPNADMGVLKLIGGLGPGATNATQKVLNIESYGGGPRMWINPLDGNTWTWHLRGDHTGAFPSLVVQSTADVEKLALLTNGSIRLGGDTLAVIDRKSAGTVGVNQNFYAANNIETEGLFFIANDMNAGFDRPESGVIRARNRLRAISAIEAGGGAFVLRRDGIPHWASGSAKQTSVGAAGAASALPATPTLYLKVMDSAGTVLVIPAYAAA